MQELNLNEVEEVSGGPLFLAVPAYFGVAVIVGELAIIGSIYSGAAGYGGGNGGRTRGIGSGCNQKNLSFEMTEDGRLQSNNTI